MTIRSIARLAGTFLMLMEGTVHAAPILWTLQNVTFDDGGTATGSFVYDADLGNAPAALSSINITTTSGSAYGGTSYSTAFFTSLPNWLAVANAPVNATHGLQLEFVSPLTNAGGTIAIAAVYAGNQNQEFTLPGGVNIRAITSGSVISAVPVPGAVWMLGGALGVLGFVRRRQDSRIAPNSAAA